MPHALSETGTTLDDKYILLGEVESNELYSLYRAENLRLGGRFLVQLGKSPDHCEAVLGAAQRLLTLQHDNLWRVIDSGTSPTGAPYVALSALEGETLGDYLERSGLPDESEALDLTRQILSGLVACHAHGLLHGHLSPQAVRLTVDDAGHPVAKLHGFGLASDAPDLRSFRAPEATHQALDERADLYSAAALLLTLLGGDPSGPKPSFPSGTNLALSTIVARCLAVDPSRRPRNAREFLRALEALDAGSPDAEMAASSPVSIVKRRRQRPIRAEAVSDSLLLSPKIPPAAPAPLFDSRDATFSSSDLAEQSQELARSDTRRRTLQATLVGIAIGLMVAWLAGFL